MNFKTYSELITLPTFAERFEYLRLDGKTGKEPFGSDRISNHMSHTSREWKMIRDRVIVRDCGRDLAAIGHEIHGQKIIIHHLNPISLEDIERKSEILLNPEFLVTTIHSTHNAIHYGDKSLLVMAPIERSKNDTCPWRH